jgi:hypothetical protein
LISLPVDTKPVGWPLLSSFRSGTVAGNGEAFPVAIASGFGSLTCSIFITKTIESVGWIPNCWLP